MKISFLKRQYWLVSLCVLAGVARINAQTITQTIVLQPGWNSVWLEVQPQDNQSSAVFNNLPVASVWTRADRSSGVDFIQNPSEEEFNRAEWQRWFPQSRPEAILNNLFAVFANRAYLIKSTNATAVNWNIAGRPSLRQPAWAPDVFNLRGLPVDPAAPPSFLNFFRHSPAHFDATTGQLRKIFRLNAAGVWTQVGPDDLARGGEACWIFSHGASDYLSPLSAATEIGDGLDFGEAIRELNFRLANHTGSPVNAVVRELNATAANHLAYYRFDTTAGGQWPVLPAQSSFTVFPDSKTNIRIAARRQAFSSPEHRSVLEVRDGAGTRLLIPTSAQLPSPAGQLRQAAVPTVRAGLWVGSATINAVSEAHSANPANVTPTKSELNLRVILHVNSSGEARLLKEVTQMWRNGTYQNNPSGDLVVDRPGEYVLLTDDTLIPFFSGAVVRDGDAVGRRISTIAYDFPSAATNNYLPLSGAFQIGQKLNGTLTLPGDHPTNPFKHKYHPDHDNLNARFDAPANESFATTRQIEFEFLSTPPAGLPVPDYGFNEMGGTYRESISGIHKNTIHLRGTFRLSRISQVAELNPSPTP
jgi:hypothetical protein